MFLYSFHFFLENFQRNKPGTSRMPRNDSLNDDFHNTEMTRDQSEEMVMCGPRSKVMEQTAQIC